MKNHRFLWLRNRTTNNRKCEKARNIKEKRTIEMFNTDLKQLVELHSSQNVNFSYARDNLRNSDLRSNPCFTRVCGVVRCGEKRWNLLSSQRICNTFATKYLKNIGNFSDVGTGRVSFLLCRFCIGSYAVLIF